MNINTGFLNFQVTPGQVQRDRLEARLYSDQNTRGPFFYGGSNLPSIRGLRGLGALGGSTDVTALATAFLQGKINPSYSTLYAMLAQSASPTALPSWVNADMATTQQVAGLLGGSAVMAPAGNYQWADPSNPTLVPWVQVSGGSFRVGDVFPPGIVLSYPDLCGAATGIAQSIPGGTVGNSCTGTGTSLPASQYQNGGGSSVQTPITSGGSSQAATQVPTFSLIDSQTGADFSNGGTFQEGDSFSVVITNAAPNSPVTVTANHNGNSSTTTLGNTSGYGSFQTTGTMDDTTVGSWTEQWQIPAGGGAAALSKSVSFSVAAAPPPASTISTVTPVTIQSGGTNTGVTQQQQSNSGSNSSSSSNATPTDNTALYVGLGIAALLILMMGEK